MKSASSGMDMQSCVSIDYREAGRSGEQKRIGLPYKTR